MQHPHYQCAVLINVTVNCIVLLAGCRRLAAEEGTCRQVAGSGISGRVSGSEVAVGTQDWVLSGLQAQERRAASSFLETSTSAAAPGTQASLSPLQQLTHFN